MIITDQGTKPFEKISCDFVGPLRSTSKGYQYILTIQDNLTKYGVFIPAIDCTSDEVSKLIMEIFIAYFGPPQSLLTDNGSRFVNKLINQFNASRNNLLSNNSIYCPVEWLY